jgi:tetratricopeptide (TPR) repeat protein
VEEEPDETTRDLVDRAKEALEQRRFQDALDICREADEKQVVHPRLIAAESVALGELERFDESQELLERGIEQFPDDATLHYNLSVIYFSGKRRGEARSEAATALLLADGPAPWGLDSERMAVIGSGALLLLRRYREATRYLERETARFPDNAQLRYRLGQSYAIRGHWIKVSRVAEPLSEEQQKSLRKVITASLFVYVISFGLIGTLFILSLYSAAALVTFAALVVALLVSAILYRLFTRHKPPRDEPA